MNQELFRKIISGQSKGLLESALRLLLNVIALYYGLGIALRNLLYDKNIAKPFAVTFAGLKTTVISQVTIPVISVGNITVGGTGKTPLVIWLCNFLQAKQIKCAILTRGYKATKGNQSDEPAVIARNCPDAELIINPDRLAGAMEAVRKHHAQVLVMDDGFQHRRLHRDIDIVTIDATLPFGFDRMLPAGLLREPVSALKRAQAAVITRSDLVSQDNLKKLSLVINGINPKAAVAMTIHAPVCAMSADDKRISLEQLRGRKVFAFCGIANPDAFFETINRLGAEVAGTKIFDDHHNYTAKDISAIYDEAAKSGAGMLLTTEKDFNKIGLPANASQLVLAYLAVKLKFISGHNQISQLIERSLTGRIREK